MALLWHWVIGIGEEDLTKCSSKEGSTLSEQTARSSAWDSGHGEDPWVDVTAPACTACVTCGTTVSPLQWNWSSQKFHWVFLKIVGRNVLLTMLGHISIQYLLTVPTRQKIHTSIYGNWIEFPWDDLLPSLPLMLSSLVNIITSNLISAWTWCAVQTLHLVASREQLTSHTWIGWPSSLYPSLSSGWVNRSTSSESNNLHEEGEM